MDCFWHRFEYCFNALFQESSESPGFRPEAHTGFQIKGFEIRAGESGHCSPERGREASSRGKFLKLRASETRGGGDSHAEQTGMLVGNFEFNP